MKRRSEKNRNCSGYWMRPSSKAWTFAGRKGIDLAGLLVKDEVFRNIEKFKTYADILLGKDEWRKAFNVYDNTISSLYEASKPEVLVATAATAGFCVSIFAGRHRQHH